MAFTIRRFIIYVKRHLFVLVLLIICFALVVSFFLYKWTELDARLDCLKKHYTDFHFTTITQAALVRSDVPEDRENIRPQSLKSDDLISQHVANRTELRLKWLRQKVERISRKVKAQSVTLTQHHSSGLAGNGPNYNIHIFYYAWYGNVAVEGHWKHWNHNYLPNWKKEDKKVYPTGSHEPPSDIGSNFYPALGCYSSRDPLIINTHMKQLRDAKVGVVVVSWYPPGHDDSPEPMMTLLLDTAQRYDLKVAPHIEPYRNRNPINFSEHLRYLINQYCSHPALYRMQKRGQDLPVFYVYDSYLTPASAWKELLSAKGNLSVRGTQLDGIFLGLLVEMQHRYDIKKAHFDGSGTEALGTSIHSISEDNADIVCPTSCGDENKKSALRRN